MAHVPLVLAPAAVEHASHAAAHAVSQHTPSTQWPVAQTPQLPPLQSAAGSQLWPWLFCPWHWPSVPQ
jgi:hypothetical protein